MTNNESAIIENLKVICLCRSIKKGTIINAVRQGADTLEKVNRKLGTGSGDCKGERCQPKIKEIIDSLR